MDIVNVVTTAVEGAVAAERFIENAVHAIDAGAQNLQQVKQFIEGQAPPQVTEQMMGEVDPPSVADSGVQKRERIGNAPTSMMETKAPRAPPNYRGGGSYRDRTEDAWGGGYEITPYRPPAAKSNISPAPRRRRRRGSYVAYKLAQTANNPEKQRKRKRKY